MVMKESPKTAYILAGGKSKRLGRDKLYVSFGSETLLERTTRILRTCFKDVALVAPGRDKFLSRPERVVADYPGACGPLAGVIAALMDTQDDCCFITAVDLPDLSESLLRQMTQAYAGEQYLGVREYGGIQPLCGVFHRSSLSVLIDCAHKRDYRMRDVIGALECRTIPLKEEIWRNINRPSDLRMIEAIDD